MVMAVAMTGEAVVIEEVAATEEAAVAAEEIEDQTKIESSLLVAGNWKQETGNWNK